MKRYCYILVILSFCLSLTGCGGCSKQNDASWFYDTEGEYSSEEEYIPDSEQDTGGNAMENPVEVEVSQGTTLAEVGRDVYSDLIELENYGLGGIKLCSEMSADCGGKWVSSFYQNTTIRFCPPPDLHLHKIVVTKSSSNIICRIVNDEISVTVGNIQNDIYRTSNEQPAFIIPVTVSNHTADTIPIVIPLGQMLEVQAPNVQNIVVCNTYSDVLEPQQAKTLNVRAYCGAEKRRDPSRYSAKFTPFILKAPAYAYNSQSSLWNFQKTQPANDKYYTITFYAWRIGTHVGDDETDHKSLTGHAFVDIPEIGIVGYSGTVTDHTNRVQYADYKISVKINETSLRKVQQKYWEWKNNPPTYELAKYDCTTFVMDIADAAGIYYGPRWAIQFPAGFMRSLMATERSVREILYLNKMSTQFLNELRTYNE